ncbi:YcaO-like family protein [Phaeobacter sp.]|uniref:YcaO-like family protein n=1 Tax=Phaeobacter sp. TaxID=1902409 RepID=UPI0025E7BA77|nr:YcaO-like family protein [Phaeobacter sp.]
MAGLAQTLNNLVDFECGLITYVSDVPTQACEPAVQIYLAEFQDPTVISDGDRPRIPNTSRQASGAGLTRTEALWSTIGEAVERYSASIYVHIPRVTALADDVYGGRAYLERLIHFTDKSFSARDVNFARPDPEIERDWIMAKRLLDGSDTAIPASLALMGFDAPRESDILDRTYSTGLACHITQEQAVVSGLHELIERDAYSSYWLTGTAPGVLSHSLVKRHLPQNFYEQIELLGLNMRVLALRTDCHTPVMVTVVAVPGGGVATGASCNLDPVQALRKAVVEAFHTFNWCLDMKRLNREIRDPTEIDDFKDHVAWYLTPERSNAYPWFTQEMVEIDAFPDDWAPIKINTLTPQAQVDMLVGRLTAAGFDPSFADLTPPDVRDAGFHVVRAFCSGLQPLSAGYTAVHTDPRRLESFMAWRGTPGAVFVTLDPPHCFP